MRADRSARRRAACLALCVAASLPLAAGCRSATTAPPAQQRTERPEDTTAALLAFHRDMQGLAAADLARERKRLGEEHGAPAKLKLALLALHPRALNLPRARALLESILAARDEEAQRMHDLARLLLEHVNERLRLDAVNERLALQLERSTAQLELATRQQEEARARAETLQRKLDALAEIERDLSAAPPPSPPPPAAPATEASPPPR